ncbi:MAG: GtrA family protein [Planctomycetes bacterium]|nr:GtrA family protein [Planctomycetota bacterium]
MKIFCNERAWPIRLWKFLTVGGTGTLVNLGLVAMLHEAAGLHPAAASVPAFAVAVTWNYTLNRLWTFRGRKLGLAGSYARYVAGTLLGLSAQVGVTWFLFERAGLFYLLASAAGIATGALFNYAASELWAFRTPRRGAEVANFSSSSDTDPVK